MPFAIDDIFAAAEETWPPANMSRNDRFTIRQGHGGGKRVSAASFHCRPDPTDIRDAEVAMSALGQHPLFMIRDTEKRADLALADKGYGIVDPVGIFAVATADALDVPPAQVSAFRVWPPLQIMRDLWRNGGIGDSRIAVMDRVTTPKTALLARSGDRAAGCAFVGISKNIAIVHAIEVTSAFRRQGAGTNILRHAARWAQDQGADILSLAVTDANASAIALYSKMGMTRVAGYHYRVKQKD